MDAMHSSEALAFIEGAKDGFGQELENPVS